MTEPQAAVQAAECLFQSVVDFDTEAERVSVFVTMLFRNAGSEPIEQPRIILSVAPSRSCDISGKILSPHHSRLQYLREGRPEIGLVLHRG